MCSSGFRLLNGEPVINTCTYAGVGQIHIPLTDLTSCNAVYTTATIDGTPQYAFATSQGCTDAIAQILADPTTASAILFDLKLGELTYPIDGRVMSVANGTNGLGYLTVNPVYSSLFNNLGCQAPACAYDPNNTNMRGQIDWNDCTVVSWGSTSSSTFAQTGLNKVSVRLNPLGCDSATKETFGDYVLCFEAVSGDEIYCSGDAGAPIYCKAFSNGEDILMGVAGTVPQCGGDSNVAVIPYSSG